MRNLRALRKRAARVGPYEDTVARFLVLVMAKVLSQEFEPSQVFASHPAWRNGSWPAINNEPSPGVAVSTPEGELRAAIEIVTTPWVLADPGTPLRWKRFERTASLDIVVPRLFLPKALSQAKKADVRLHDVWSYSINHSRKVQVVRETGNHKRSLGVDTEFILY